MEHPLDSLEQQIISTINALQAVRPLVNALPESTEILVCLEPVALNDSVFAELLLVLTTKLLFNKNIQFVAELPKEQVSFCLAVNNYLKDKFAKVNLAKFNAIAFDELTSVAEELVCRLEKDAGETVYVQNNDVKLRVHLFGDKNNPPLMLASACGMPLALSLDWLKHLQQFFYVVTWDTRCLDQHDGKNNSEVRETDVDTSVAAQVEDLVHILNELKLHRPHLMGFCGGAVIALRAMACYPELFKDGSVWHGDFHFDEKNEKKEHQQNVAFLMEMGAKSRVQACSYRKLMERPASLNTLPMEEAPLILYPYANDELFYQYCKLNGAIMSHSISSALSEVSSDVLVVTSKTDHTAHPEGSRRVARELANALLVEKPEGDHISLFRASQSLRKTADDFLLSHSDEAGTSLGSLCES